jgi:hypothetical protein
MFARCRRTEVESQGFGKPTGGAASPWQKTARTSPAREAAYWRMLKYNEEGPHDALGDLTPIEYAITARNSSSELSP